MTTQTAPARTAAEIRDEFIEFFRARHGHAVVPSAPVVPHADPTLLFTNAGMNQFKDVFLGQGERDYARAVNSQKCIRAGGKHNDLEDVGTDTYHHTFFEMLGNWSFGDYFKAEAIEWAWTLLTDVWRLDPERLHVTVFAGDEGDGLEPDVESEDLWKRHVDPSRISRWDRADNFWEMGETGPCGPCSEIHYDFTPDGTGAELVNSGDPRVIELWNLVFIQFNRGDDGRLVPLPARHVDTGMGLERLVRVLQHRDSNYDTDLWTPLFEAIANHTEAPAYGGALDDPVDVAYRVIADHARCLAVAIADGAQPSNEGRGYVLRRILRRAVRHAHQTLRVPGPMLRGIMPAVVDSLGGAYPELVERRERIESIVEEEETAFLRTLDRGLAHFTEAVERAVDDRSRRIDADDAFKLHDTYGFPIDLTCKMAEERELTVDVDGYETLMEEARERSRQGGDGEKEITLPPDALARLRHLGVEATETDAVDAGRPVSGTVRAIWNGRDFDDEAHIGRQVAVILDRTSLYAESGGQVGDRGELQVDDDADSIAADRRGDAGGTFRVRDTRAVGGFVLHVGSATDGELAVGDEVTAVVHRARRESIRANHTATHLLNWALREVLGETDQKGSLVADDRLRFDFACPHALTPEQIDRVQLLVNERILESLEVHAGTLPLAEARRITGVRAVFGERYPDPVRVVSIGAPVEALAANPEDPRWRELSIEFCGGTHLRATEAAERFVIVGEQALAAGVRRIVAVTGAAAVAANVAGQRLLEQLDEAASLTDEPLVEAYEQISQEVEHLTIAAPARHEARARLEAMHEDVKRIRKASRRADRANLVERARLLARDDDAPIIVHELPDADRDNLLAALDAMQAHREKSAILLAGRDDEEGKIVIVAAVPESLVARGLKAGEWVKAVASECGGGGGGRPDRAQAGGKDPEKLPVALARARMFAETALSV